MSVSVSIAATNTPYAARRTPLFELHVEHGGTANPWQGWQIPSHYDSILEEHRAALESLSLFDLGFRGYARLQGPDALGVLNELFTCEVTAMAIGSLWQVPMVYPDGTIVDWVSVTREEEQSWLLVFANPAYQKALSWISEQARGTNSWLDDLSAQYAWVSLVGPRAMEFFQKFSPASEGLKVWQMGEFLCSGVAVCAWRRGEGVLEISCQPELLTKVARVFSAEASRPRMCGWASYENWQLEQGLLRYGYEIKDGASPFELGLDKKVELGRDHFIGRSVLIEQQRDGLKHILVHFTLDAMRLPRKGAAIYCGQRLVGRVTAGGFGVAYNRPIGSAWVMTDEVDFDCLELEVRKQRFPLTVRKTPLRP